MSQHFDDALMMEEEFNVDLSESEFLPQPVPLDDALIMEDLEMSILSESEFVPQQVPWQITQQTRSESSILGEIFQQEQRCGVNFYEIPPSYEKEHEDSTCWIFSPKKKCDPCEEFPESSSQDVILNEALDIMPEPDLNSDLRAEKGTPQLAVENICCGKSSRKLAHHLRLNMSCLRKVMLTLNIQGDFENIDSTVRAVMAARAKKLKSLQSSRLAERRRTVETQSVANLMSAFHKKNSNSTQYYTCLECQFSSSNINKFTKVDIPNQIDESFIYPNGVFLCKSCQSHVPLAETQDLKGILRRVSMQGRNIYAPTDLQSENSCSLSFPPTIAFPTDIPINPVLENPSSRPDLQARLHKRSDQNKLSVEEFCEAAYETQLHRIEQRTFIPVQTGKILNEREKIIEIDRSFKPNLSRVSGTSDYFEKASHDTKFQWMANGYLAVSTEIEVPRNTLGVFRRFLNQQNRVTIEDSGFLRVHTKHNMSVECNGACTIWTLEDCMTNTNFREYFLDDPALLSLHADMVSDFFNSITNLLKNLLNVNDYVATIRFPLDGLPRVHALFWPAFLEEINLSISNSQTLTPEQISSLEDNVEKMLSCSMSKDFFSNSFNNQDSESLSFLAAKKQYFSSEGVMPSNKTLLKRPPVPSHDDWGLCDSNQFISVMSEVQDYFLNLFNVTIKKEHFSKKSQTTLDDVLKTIEMHESFFLKKESNFLQLKFHDSEVFNIPIDMAMSVYVNLYGFSWLSSVYHRSMTLTDSVSHFDFLMKRERLQDIFISEFNPHVLLASKTTNFIQVIGTDQEKAILSMFDQPINTEESLNDLFLDHTEMTLLNSFFVVDSTKKLILRSRKCTFINPCQADKGSFRKVKNLTLNKTYTEKNTGQFYERTESIYEKYLSRDPTYKLLTFMQFCMLYKPPSGSSSQTEESENQPSNFYIATSEDDKPIKLPSVLELKSGYKLTMQTPQVITYPIYDKGTSKYIELMCRFYFPHSSRSAITETNQITIFQSLDKVPLLKPDRTPYTKIETIMLKLFPKYSENLFDKLFYS